MAIAIAVTIAVLATLGFIGWLLYRAVRRRPIKAYIVTYGVACITGVFTLVFFLGMDIPQLVKILVSILLGIALIVGAAVIQRRRQAAKP